MLIEDTGACGDLTSCHRSALANYSVLQPPAEFLTLPGERGFLDFVG